MLKRYHLGLAAFSLVLTLLIFIGTAVSSTIQQGTSQTFGQGTAYSYVILDRQGKLSSIGVTLSESALNQLPDAVLDLDLPLPQAATAVTPFTHISVNWKPQGHMPEPIYGTPHFDFHFFTISQDDRHAITATGDDLEKSYKTPDADLVPVGYVLAPESAEPLQGSHWINPQSAEFQGLPHGFNHTFIYGFYDGTMSFMEPMISLPTLEQHQSVNETIALPVRNAELELHPTHYTLTYNAQAQEYRISLDGFQPAD